MADKHLDMTRRSLPLTLTSLLAAGVMLTAVRGSAQGLATDYQAKLAQYQVARSAYEAEASNYWDAIAEKRRSRNTKRRDHLRIGVDDYVLTQPPVYSGPPRPVDPNAPALPPSERPEIPVISDFLQNAAEQFGFVPDRPATDVDFKRAYAKAAAAAGLTRDQIVGVYAFETGGNGTYDSQAGLVPYRAGARAISPAMGYNQLLSTNTVSLLAEDGNRYLAALRKKANVLNGSAKLAMERKIEALKRMITYSRSVPNRWSEHDRLAKTTAGGFGIHAAVLDIDLGPLLQVQKLTELGPLRARQGIFGTTRRRRTGIDEPNRRRQWLRHGNHAARLARPRADREFLPATRLRAQPSRTAHRRGCQSHRRHRKQDEPLGPIAGRARSRSGVLELRNTLAVTIIADPRRFPRPNRLPDAGVSNP